MKKNQNADKAELYSGNRAAVGDRLKEYMETHNLKQVDIIEKTKPFSTSKLKITKTDLSQYVNNKTEPRSDKLHLLAKALDVDEAWLLGFDEHAHKPSHHNSTSRNENESQQADLDDDDTIFTFQGRPIPPEDLKIIRRLLKNDDDE